MGFGLRRQEFGFVREVAAEGEHVLAALSDYTRYAKALPEFFPFVRVRSARGNVAVAEQHVMLGGRRLVMLAKHVTTPPGLHEAFVLGGDIKGSSFRHELEQSGGRTVLRVSASINLGFRDILGRRGYGADYERLVDGLLGSVL